LSKATVVILWLDDATVKQLNSINIIGISDCNTVLMKKAPEAKLQRLLKYVWTDINGCRCTWLLQNRNAYLNILV